MEKNFNINVTMEERWIPHFLSFLKYMQSFGNQGHSAQLGFYSDGDGDFRPRFNFNIPYDNSNVFPITKSQIIKKKELYNSPNYGIPEYLFDAG